jgi:hypothetical protein
MRPTSAILATAFALFLCAICRGTVTDVRLYRLGEADLPPAVPLGAGDPITMDSAGGIPAMKVGLEYYHAIFGGGGPPTLAGIAPGSTVAMRFTNVDSRYVAPAVAGLTNNFGIEAYLAFNHPLGANAIPFYDGGPGFPIVMPPDGFGIRVVGGQYEGVIGGVGVIPSGVFTTTLPVAEAALVRWNGVFHFYLNRQDMGMLPVAALPVLATDMVSIGNFDGGSTPPDFQGIVDEARIFTFNPNTFDPGTDLGAAPAMGILTGDANRDGSVRFDDLLALAQHYNDTHATWEQGDFNGDGKVDFGDLLALAQHYGDSLYPPAPAGELASVPEPVVAALLLFGGLGLMRSRRGR